MIFTAPSGVTNVYSGLISGTGPAIIEGGGTVAFSHANNTYTGGTLVSNAVFRLDADGCAGVGAITAAVRTAHIYMNCAHVPNDMRFNYECTEGAHNASLTPSDYPPDSTHPLYPLAASIVVDGKVSFKGYEVYTSGTSASGFQNSTVTFNKDFTAGGRMDMATYGTTIFKGLYSTANTTDYRQYIGWVYSANGTVELHSSSNRIGTCALCNASIYLKAKDALPYSLLCHAQGRDSEGKLFLCGNDQTFRGVCWNTKDSPPNPGETATGQCWSSDDPATVRIIGCASNISAGVTKTWVNKLAMFGKITLVMDVDPSFTSGGFYQEFSVRRSTTAGDLIISNGDFRVSGTASFPNVQNIYVGEGGTFSNGSTKPSAFAGCRNLTVLGKMSCTGNTTPFAYDTMALSLGAGAEFSLPAGCTITVTSLKIDNASMPDGKYGDGGIALSQIARGTVVVRARNRYVDCVNGSDANDGSEEHPFKTIRAATTNAISGDVIHVAPGRYGEAEGSQKWPDASSEIGTRVVIPAGVTLESTGGATNTFIVGAASPNPLVTEGWRAGIGPGAVRCVVAGKGATLRGFTLTGGYTHAGAASVTEDKYASACYATADTPATIEDCIISNNVAQSRTLYYGIVRRCMVLGNTAAEAGTDSLSGAAGIGCSWYGTIIANNRGNSTVINPRVVEGCTLGSGNVWTEAGGLAHVLRWTEAGRRYAIVNTVWLYGPNERSDNLYCTNCVVMPSNTSFIPQDNMCDTIVIDDASGQLDEKWRPVLGSFVGMDKGNAAYSSASSADKDIYGNQRIMNGAMDIGAVEYDWRPEYMKELSRRFRIEVVSPAVTTNATGGVRMPSGHIYGTCSFEGAYDVSVDVTGGVLAVYVEGALVGNLPGIGEQSLRFVTPVASASVQFVFTPDAENPGAAVLRKISSVGGFTVTFR